MKINDLTEKQERAAQEYVKCGDKTMAYEKAGYSMKSKSREIINQQACRVFANSNVAARVLELQKIAENTVNKFFTTTIEELVSNLVLRMNFDPADLYDESGNLKSIHDIPKPARQMLAQLDTEEIFEGRGDDRVWVGTSKKVKYKDSETAIEKLMKWAGGYQKDNEQKKPEVKMEFDMTAATADDLKRIKELYKKPE